MQKLKNNFWIILIIVASIPTLVGIFHAGFFMSDDGSSMVIRLSAFYEALSSGQFPTRFLPRLDQGIGYPVAGFLYPLFLYLGSMLHVIKIPFLLDIKLIFAAGMVFSGFGMYVFLKKYFSSFSAFIGAVVYIYLPYHLYDMYVRGSVGEVLSLAIAPFLFWAISEGNIFFASIFLAFLILAHNTLALFFLPVVLLFGVLQKKSFKFLTIFTILGLGLSSFFWIPALFDKQFTIFDTVAVANPFIYFVNNVSYALVGWIGVTILIAAAILYVTNKQKETVFFFLLAVVSLFFSFSISNIFWYNKTLIEFIQFPFRFLSLALLSESFLAAYIIEKLHKNILIIGVFLALLIFSSFPYLFPKNYSDLGESFYTTNVESTTVKNEYAPRWVLTQPKIYAYQRITLSTGIVQNLVQKGTRVSFTTDVTKQTTCVIAFSYFPGWNVTIDGKTVEIVPTEPTGLIEFTVPKGTHAITVSFQETPIRLLADGLSIVSLILVGFLLLKKRYDK